ncbi:Chromogranin-A [Galemys pyrenaicus]|uniref:Chromogranin-A n=1 Tax=Galemys pyrenaicus TaxID=202257 RepID=A0A8J6AMJ7_GALPY|nr:Chromogranin-A [Galemys pyrenaicus]
MPLLLLLQCSSRCREAGGSIERRLHTETLRPPPLRQRPQQPVPGAPAQSPLAWVPAYLTPDRQLLGARGSPCVPPLSWRFCFAPRKPKPTPACPLSSQVMKCIVEVISDTLSKPSPLPVSQGCFQTLRGDERILSILRHQNLLKELQDLALQGAKERAQQQKKHSSFEDELSEVVGKQSDRLKEATEDASPEAATEKRGDPEEVGTNGPQTSPELGSEVGASPAPGAEEEEEKEDANSRLPTALPNDTAPDSQTTGDREGPAGGLAAREKAPRAEQGQQAEGEDAEAAATGEQALQEEDGPAAALGAHPRLDSKEVQRGWPEARKGARKIGAEEAQTPKEKGEQEPSLHEEEEEEEEVAGAAPGLFQGGKSGELEPEEERLSKEWEDARRWSAMGQLAKELTAEKRQDGEDGEQDDPDRSMKLSFRTRAYDFRGPRPQPRRGWRPSSREDSVEAGLPLQVRGFPEEKKEEEGSANRRAEDQELESLSVIEAELEKVAHRLQALRQG